MHFHPNFFYPEPVTADPAYLHIRPTIGLPLDQSLSEAHAMSRVIVRLESMDYNCWDAADSGLRRWYEGGLSFMENHYRSVIWEG